MFKQLCILDANWIATLRSGKTGQKHTKPCRKCGKVKVETDFPYFSTSSAGRKNTCKQCSNELAQVRAKLRKQNPPPPAGECPSCGRHTESWVLDHCHTDDTFRGYICNSCNLGFGKFNDDPEILKRSIDYLINSTRPDETTKNINRS